MTAAVPAVPCPRPPPLSHRPHTPVPALTAAALRAHGGAARWGEARKSATWPGRVDNSMSVQGA